MTRERRSAAIPSSRKRLQRTLFAIIMVAATAIISLATAPASSAKAAQSSQDPFSKYAVSRQHALTLYKKCKPTLKVFHPSAALNPLTASATQLRAAGLPARPNRDNKKDYSAWAKAMSRPLHFTNPHPVCTRTRHSLPSSKQSSASGNKHGGGSWSGYTVPMASDYGSNALAVEATSTWVQPAVAASQYSGADAPTASFWTGLGQTSSIIQAGCDSAGDPTPQYNCWTEDYPLDNVYEGPVVRPGDYVYVDVEYTGLDITEFYIENETTGETQTFLNATPDVSLDSADYMLEQEGDTYFPNIGSVPVSENYYTVSQGLVPSTEVEYTLGDAGVDSDSLVSLGTTLAAPSAIDPTGGFTQQFYASS